MCIRDRAGPPGARAWAAGAGLGAAGPGPGAAGACPWAAGPGVGPLGPGQGVAGPGLGAACISFWEPGAVPPRDCALRAKSSSATGPSRRPQVLDETGAWPATPPWRAGA
eukprot:8424223-Pyramimonas_sp.AAC.1